MRWRKARICRARVLALQITEELEAALEQFSAIADLKW